MKISELSSEHGSLVGEHVTLEAEAQSILFVACECNQRWCVFVHFVLRPMNERMSPSPSPAQLQHWLPSMSPYIMSHMHLGSFSLTRLEKHSARRLETPELDVFSARDRLPVVPW